ncbi:MAG: ThiF family adenylyltransferase [Phycisphaerae bacterium]|nr:ThiF family adenylyltransferase [Phycisphaerae bacterium]MCZ2400607.1 ThiF family adenylyltransferase [Phycisphaerae bacterium]
MDPQLARYSRQMLFERIGPEGQRRLKHASVALIGCGALGSALADMLIRAGVGQTRLIDRDFVEISNLQRQTLFDEHDVAANLPKAVAAARKLKRVNSAVEVEPVVADVNCGNAVALCEGADLILDGTDNFETRYLINDVAVKLGTPWVYGACTAAEGMMMVVIPGRTPCLRCLWADAPPPGSTPTCETAGVLAPAVQIVAGFQAIEALKLLAGREDDLLGRLLAIEAWTGRVRTFSVEPERRSDDCPCCAERRFEYLSGEKVASSVTLCGRNAVQVLPPAGARVEFKQVAAGLPGGARAVSNEFLLRFQADGCGVTLFPDGRAIITGTADTAVARGIYARYIGS